MLDPKCIAVSVLLVFFGACRRGEYRQDLGAVELRPNVEAVLPFRIPKNPDKRRWSLGFSSKNDPTAWAQADRVILHLQNDDQTPLTISLNPDDPRLTIQPSVKAKIFDGTFENLILLGRGQAEAMTIDTSREKEINATLIFSSNTQGDALRVKVSAYYFLEGF